MSCAGGPDLVTNGLVICLDAADKQSYSGSGTIWRDLVGSNDGTLTNGPTYSSAGGGSIVFDGANDFVQCLGSLTVTAATFVTWIRRNGSQGTYDGILFSRGTNNTTGMSFYGFNQLGYTWNDSPFTYNWNSGLTIPDLTWCMVAISVTSTAATAYLCESSRITSATNTLSHGSSLLDDIKIGVDEFQNRCFTGNIATAMIYNRALSANEISQNYNALKGRFLLT